jgi:small subunit ribosomal protein S11
MAEVKIKKIANLQKEGVNSIEKLEGEVSREKKAGNVVDGKDKVVKEIKTKKDKVKEDKTGIAYVYSSGNNTIVHVTDLAGNTLSRISGGMITKHSRLKSNPTTAMFVAKKAAERPRDLGITSLYIRMRGKTGGTGHGPGAHAAVKTLGKEGFRVVSVLDSTRVARGGPKKKGGRRGRRV